MPIIGSDSINPLQAPPSATSDNIKSCHSQQQYGESVDTQTDCYRDVPTRNFALISAGVPDFSGPVTYVSYC
jgi:hypothetical protein